LKKSQTATEYLIILAVVIVVSLIVVGIMGGIPGIGKSLGRKASSSYWKSADIAIDSYSNSAGGSVTLNVRNNLDSAINIISFEVASVNLTTLGTLSPGQSTTLSGSGLTCTAGQAFSHNVTIVYQDMATNAIYSTSGDGHKLEGACSS